MLFERSVGTHIRKNGRVRNILDQPGSKNGSRNAENKIVYLLHGFEIGLGQGASAGVGPSGDGEECVHSTIWSVCDRTAGIYRERESRFAHGPVRCDERWNLVCGTTRTGGQYLRV